MPYRHCAAPIQMLALLLCLLLLSRAHASSHGASANRSIDRSTVAARHAGAADPAGHPGGAKRLQAPDAAGYRDLAAALRKRMDGKAEPTPALGALARELTAGLADPRARALALSDWVRTHIRHAVRHFDGAAPRPAAAVLENRYGGDEEIAVLLQALLAASGIDSSAALVSQGANYTLPDVPAPDTFDHVIVYLPSLELYLDPTAETIAAGYLPPSLLGKPVLLLASGGFAMTPAMQPQSVRTTATVDLRRDGSGSFRLDRTYAGALAEPFRKAVRDVPPAARDQFVRRMLQGLGQPGHGALEAGPLDASGGDYRMTLSGASKRFVNLPGARGLPTTYPYFSTVGDAVAGMAWETTGSRDVVCPAIDAEDETVFRLPQGVRIAALPQAVSVIQGGVFYRASYARQRNGVLVKRRLTFRSGRPTCSAAEVRAMQPALARMARDLDSRITIVGR